MPTYSYPGVYIEEFEPAAPIQPLGTSTAAFLGPTLLGTKNFPQKITSFDQFKNDFGDTPVPGGYFLYYAVRGFFENGGTTCYVVRTSNGEQASHKLLDAAGKTVATIKAHDMGSYADNMQMNVTAAHLLTGATLYQPTAPYTVIAGTANTIQVSTADAAQFKQGDYVNLGPNDKRCLIASISGTKIRLSENLVSLAGGTMRLADTAVGQTIFRVISSDTKPLKPNTLSPGSVLTITQGNAASEFVDSVQVENLGTTPPVTTYRVLLRRGFSMPVDYTTQADVQTEEFNLTITLGSAQVYQNLGVDPDHPKYFVNVIANDASAPIVVDLQNPPPNSRPPNNIPSNLSDGQFDPGTDENLETLTSNEYTDALDALGQIDDVNQIAAPDALNLQTTSSPPQNDPVGAAMVQQAIIAHCELYADRFGVLDALAPYQPKFPDPTIPTKSIEEQRTGLTSTRGYVALYYPWLKIAPAGAGAPILVPPSGHVCGLIARIDDNRGVFKAPAGLEATIDGAVDIDTTMSNIDHGQLNLLGINVIRVFSPGGRPTLFGARTTAIDTNWQYVNIRRMFLFLEKSIKQSLRGSVFEPNSKSLWAGLKRSIGAFLTEQWQEGALFGAKASDAFYVRIDDVLNPFTEQQLGRLHIEVGVRPTYPAEFIIVRIGIWDGGSTVTET